MLSSLHIENIAVIKRLDADFSEGFTVLTGETGAGKSILIDSIAFLTGAKAQRELIRSGEEKACVSGLFTDVPADTLHVLSDYEIEPDENGAVVIVKTMTKDGKVSVKINGRSVTSSAGRACAVGLINIHGQHDNQALLDSANHIRYLDRYAGNDALLENYSKIYAEYRSIQSAIKHLTESERDKQRKKDLLEYQINDIENAALTEGEEESLLAKKKVIQNSKQIAKNIVTAYRALYKNSKGVTACALIENAADAISALSDVYDRASEVSGRLFDIQAEIEDTAKKISTLIPTDIEDPEKELENINERLNIIKHQKRKYGADVGEVLSFLENAKKELAELESSDEKLAALREEEKEKIKTLTVLSSELHDRRASSGKTLSEEICIILKYLDMGKVSLLVSVRTNEGEDPFTQNGYDRVEFYISTNIGEPMKPLSKIASGGELSRIMLAIKCVLADAEAVPTIIFDEVDTGVSGKTSQKIGLKLHELSATTQVICITHSAQIAALADNHFKIIKEEDEGRVKTSLVPLDKQGRIDEIARIIAGVRITQKTIETAREMLETIPE